MSRFDETWHWLHWWTKGNTESERLAAHLIADAGYDDSSDHLWWALVGAARGSGC